MSRYPTHPKHPERTCWGCERFCSVKDMGCNKVRAEHPVEVFGPDWLERFPELTPEPDEAPKSDRE